MKSLDNKTKYFASETIVSFAISGSRSLLGLAILVSLLYGGALLLASTFDFLFRVA